METKKQMRKTGFSKADKIKALMTEFGYTRKEAVMFLKDMGE